MKNNESKYKQVVNFVIDSIAEGKLQKGDWIPSINEFRENYHLSRDTVFAGLSELKSRGIIASTPGVGYYIASARIPRNRIFSCSSTNSTNSRKTSTTRSWSTSAKA